MTKGNTQKVLAVMAQQLILHIHGCFKSGNSKLPRNVFTQNTFLNNKTLLAEVINLIFCVISLQ